MRMRAHTTPMPADERSGMLLRRWPLLLSHAIYRAPASAAWPPRNGAPIGRYAR